MTPITRYPLHWPAGRPRSPQRQRSKFKTTFARARDALLEELRRHRAADVVLSTNVELRRDDLLPRADRKAPADPGVAVYFRHKGRDVCFACDRWDRVEDNLHAVNLTIQAIRGMARWGTGDMVDAAFSGFTALPARAAPAAWYVTLGVPAGATAAEADAAYRRLVLAHHPDRGGDTARMAAINDAYERMKKERGA